MKAHRMRAPATNGGLLVEPPAHEVAARIAANRYQIEHWDHDFQGRSAERLRALVRREITTLAVNFLDRHGLAGPAESVMALSASDRPLIVTGHQPELFHPGVWVKNFAAAGIARRAHGVALNLIVDNDIPKSSAIRVPASQNGLLRSARVEFDRWESEIPYEDLTVHDEAAFDSFPRRVREVMIDSVDQPLLDEFWPRATGRRSETRLSGLRFALARHETEAEWGVRNLEVPLSEVCETDGFLWFVAHILAQLPRYREVYNEALLEYRRAHGIRSKNHPVAALAREGDWLEAPFWVWRAQAPRRHALLTRQRGRVMELRIDGEDHPFVELPLTSESEGCCAVDRLRELPRRSIRLRTRALTTTMFSRFLVGDLFIHGIGGAKYDELGDEIARRFFGVEPPGYLALSMTLWLGLPEDTVSAADLRDVERLIRDLKFNPDRHLREPFSEEIRSLVRAKRAAIAGAVDSHQGRVDRFRAIRRANEQLQASISGIREEMLATRARLSKQVHSNRVARNREFALVLYSADRLRTVLTSLAREYWE